MSLTLYLHPLASYCHKVLIALYENDTPFKAQRVDLSNASERAALLELWPIGKFPVLRDVARNQIMPESTVIIEYLDRHYPGPTRFLPADADLALQTRLQDRFYDLYVHEPMQKIVGDRLRPQGERDSHGVEEARARLKTSYGMIDREMTMRTWAMGDAFSPPCRLRRRAGAVLCQRGLSDRRRSGECLGVFGPPPGTSILCARAEGSRAVLRDVPAIAPMQPASPSEYLARDVGGAKPSSSC
jgi:glutathione S-transferase